MFSNRKKKKKVSLKYINKVWIRNDHIKQKLKQKQKLKLYQALVTPVLTYNSGTWGLTKTQEDHLGFLS